jgi:uncharacterized protein Yka (UPF0111/DUF47 family)
MTQDEIIDMAREIAAQYSKAERFQTWTHDFMMQRLMYLVTVSAAKEREACAKVVESIEAQCIAKDVDDPPLEHVAAAIRARGEA